MKVNICNKTTNFYSFVQQCVINSCLFVLLNSLYIVLYLMPSISLLVSAARTNADACKGEIMRSFLSLQNKVALLTTLIYLIIE